MCYKHNAFFKKKRSKQIFYGTIGQGKAGGQDVKLEVLSDNFLKVEMKGLKYDSAILVKVSTR